MKAGVLLIVVRLKIFLRKKDISTLKGKEKRAALFMSFSAESLLSVSPSHVNRNGFGVQEPKMMFFFRNKHPECGLFQEADFSSRLENQEKILIVWCREERSSSTVTL